MRPISSYTLGMSPDTKVSENFALWELTKSETAERLLIDNSFESFETLHNAVLLARSVMQPIRDEFGPYSPNSVYRCQALERALKNKPSNWISKSQHTLGMAVDAEIAGVTNYDLALWVMKNIDFDQLILECYNPDAGPNSGWVHVSSNPEGNRGEVMSYIKKAGRYVYVPGLITDVG